MLQLCLYVALAPCLLAADETLSVGTQLNYRGAVFSETDEQDRKTFDLTLWILARREAGADVFWLVSEQGRGELPWPDRFGRASLDGRWQSAAAGPKLLYDRGEGRSFVALAMPFLKHDAPLAPGVEFENNKLTYRVEKPSKAGDRPAWRVSVRDPFGDKRSLRVDQQTPLVLTLEERFTMGQGKPYRMELELVSSEPLAGDPLGALAKAIEKLTAVRSKLNLPAESQEIQWKPEQMTWLTQELPGFVELSAGTPLEKLAAAAARDLQLQSQRKDAVSTLSSKFVGHQVEDFQLRGTGKEALGLADLKDKVTVLHFWDYRDEPLKEPYGQVGYLDFLNHRRKAAGLQLYGVAVDARLTEEKTRPAAERSVRKLKDFMNLSYPVLFDTAGLLKQFGDPRLVGASLPLFVVIGTEGKVIHYHVGMYDVNQDQGLKELDEVVSQALEKVSK